jgi:hypothetical protein
MIKHEAYFFFNIYVEVFKYYYNMLGYLELNNLKRFLLLPQLSYVRFDSRFISTIYDELQIKENKRNL